MADLRCALSPARLPRAWPLLAPVGGIGNTRIETVAGLFAYHPDEASTGNLGTTCRLLAAGNNSFDGRFRRLLSCDRDEICERLRPVVLAARAKGVKINYEELFVDLWYWGDKAKARWAREYWGVPESEESGAAPEAAA
ncbi:MAG: type I-E CRISPR-associated protein Cse2/CasB [Bryobacteraceae bacterium]|nr:type I-E CRISPR-associated protein Cse2/CasB [Bryobacteraceae bacterium]